jgi:rubrerythrin
VTARQTPGTRSTPGSLAAIDAAVDGCCACGCGAELDPVGPSAWFASEGCQRRYQRRAARRPDEVLGPLAAEESEERLADMLVGMASAVRGVEPALRAMGETFAAFARALGGPPVSRMPIPAPSTWVDDDAARRLRREEGWQSARAAGSLFEWRRWCRPCGGFAVPMLVPAEVHADQPWFCPACGTAWPGPRLLAQWREDEHWGGVFVLRLAAPGWCQVTHHVAAVEVQRAGADIVSHTWERMDREIVDGLTFRDRCKVDGCAEIGRAYFRARRAVSLVVVDGNVTTYLPLPAGDWWLCPGHEHELCRAVDSSTGVPLLEETWVASNRQPSHVQDPAAYRLAEIERLRVRVADPGDLLRGIGVD